MADYDVIVIGAGTGGLTAGALLAAQGRSVLVLEQSERVGGCCSTFEHRGYHFDLGASLIESPSLIDQAFKRMGTSLALEVDLLGCDPMFNVILKNGERLRYPVSSEACEGEIANLAPEEVAGWREYMSYMSGFTDALGDFFTTPAVTMSDVAAYFARSPKMLRYLPLFLGSYRDVLRKFFRDPRIRESLSYQSLYVGLPPELAPGLFAVIPHNEHNGIFYSRGGMIGIPAALQRCGERLGMKVQLNTLVQRVLVRNGRAVGVVLADGSEISAKVIVSDINARTLYLDLIGEQHLPWLARVGIRSYEYAMAVPMLYLGLNYTPPLESHHTLATIPGDDMDAFWWQTYKRNRYPEEQFGIISWTSGTDPSLAPKGKHVVILTLAPGPYRLEGADWDAVKPALTEKIVRFFSQHYIPGLEEHVEVAELATPLDFERRLRAPEGAVYAFRQDVTNELVFRPAAKSKSIQGLYLAGASTHPGGGVPTTIASGMIAADLIDRYEHK